MSEDTAAPRPPAPEDQGLSDAEARRELASLDAVHERRRRLLPRAALVGLLGGAVGIAFRRTLEVEENLRTAAIAVAHRHGAPGFLAVVAGAALATALVVFVVRRLAPEIAGSGIPHLKAVLDHLRPLRWRRVVPLKFATGAIGIGAGLALGREGPTVQMGGGVGEMVAQLLPSTARERLTLIAAGAGAGVAAAFNAPLAGLVFVLEELQHEMRAGLVFSTFVAAVIADVVARLVSGQLPVFHVAAVAPPPLSALGLFLVLGFAAGALGVAFNRSLVGTLDLFARVRRPVACAAAVGALVGTMAWFAPGLVGGGGALVQATLSGAMPAGEIPVRLASRFVLTVASYGTGAPGGIFGPLLVLGAQLGRLVAALGDGWFVSTVPLGPAFAVVGMAALFAAIVRAPLTGIVLVVEMTGGYSLMLPLLAASFAAASLADFVGDRPIYEALLARDLRRGGHRAELAAPLLLELVVQPGAVFAGRSVAELGLPSGCLLVKLERAGDEQVPSAATVLAVGDRVSALLAPGAAAAAEHLRRGLGAHR